MEGILMDGKTYHVMVVFPSRQRSFRLIEGKNAGPSLSQRSIRDLKGTSYGYMMQVERNPEYPEDYDAFYEAISEPVDFHEITMPYNQGTITFEAKITGGTDVDEGVLRGRRKWRGLTVAFEPMEPQRKA